MSEPPHTFGATFALVLWASSAAADPHPQHHSTRHVHVDAASYGSHVRAWHDRGQVPAARYTPEGVLVLRMVSLNTRAVVEVTPQHPEGGFDTLACDEISRVMEDSSTHTRTPVDRRLVEVVYQIARHFHAGQVTVVSGYRAGSQHSNHQLGRAIDIVIPGASDESVAAYARTLGLVGVGVYPRSGFVHIDVRPASYFWVDRSAPGRACRLHEMLGTVARRSDATAHGRGVTAFGGNEGASDPAADGADATDACGASSATHE